jgi:hypothetical protein
MCTEFFSCLSDCGEFTRGQAESFSPVPGQGCSLAEALPLPLWS